jgi:transposase-like protein
MSKTKRRRYTGAFKAKVGLEALRGIKTVGQIAREYGKNKWMAVRKLAFKWIRILWRCWQTQQPYDETKYLRSLQRDGVELYRSLYEALPPLPPTAVNNS